MGTPSAPVEIIEFSDYECPYCRSLEEDLREVVRAYPGRIGVVRYDFPLTSVHPNAYIAAIAAECGAQQGVFEPLQERLFESGAKLGSVDWVTLARQANVPNARVFSQCLRQEKTAGLVRGDVETGKRLGVQGTPTLIINGNLLEGTPSSDELKQLVGQIVEHRPQSTWQRIARWF